MSLEQQFVTKFRTHPHVALRSLYQIEDSELWLRLFSLLPLKTQKYLLRSLGFHYGKYEEMKDLYLQFPYLRNTIAFVYACQFLHNLYSITHTFEKHPDEFFENMRFDTSLHIHMPMEQEFQSRIRKYIRALNRSTGILSESTQGYCEYSRKMLKYSPYARDRAPIEPFDQRSSLCLLYENPPKLEISLKMKRRNFLRLNRKLDSLFDTYIEGLLDEPNDILESILDNLPS